jgi:hypothetical protein
MAKLQTKEEVLACLRESIENGKMLITLLSKGIEMSKGGDGELKDDVLKNRHRLRLLKCYEEKEGEDAPGFLEVYYDKDDEGNESILISFNVKPDPDPKKCEWHTYKTPYENVEDMAEMLAHLQQTYYDEEMFEGTVWQWKNVDIDGKLIQCNIRKLNDETDKD